MSLRDILAQFTIGVDDRQLKEGHKGVEGFKKTIKEVAEVLATTFAVDYFKEFLEGQIQAGVALKTTATRLGTTTTELQSMQLAAGEAGVSSDALTTSLRFLNRNISQGQKAGDEHAKTFKELGVSIKDASGHARPAGDVIGDLATAIASIDDPAKKTQVAMQLLGRGGAELIPLLNKGGAAFDEARAKLQELGGGMSEGFVESAHEAEKAQIELSVATEGLKSRFAQSLFPILTTIIETMTKYTTAAVKFEKETHAISTAVEFFGTIAAVRAIGPIGELLKKVGLLKDTVSGTIGAFAGFATAAVVISLLYLVFDDLVKLLQGNDSLIGRLLGPDKKTFVDDMRGAVDELRASFVGLGEDGESSGSGIVEVLQDAFNILKDMLGAIADVSGALDDLVNGRFGRALAGAENVGERILRSAPGANLAGAPVGNPNALENYDKEQNAAEASREKDQQSGEKQELFRQRIKKRLGIIATQKAYNQGTFEGPTQALPSVGHDLPSEPLPAFLQRPPTNFVDRPKTGDGAHVSVNQNNVTTIEVHGSNDPEATGKAVGQGVATANERNNNKAATAWKKP